MISKLQGDGAHIGERKSWIYAVNLLLLVGLLVGTSVFLTLEFTPR